VNLEQDLKDRWVPDEHQVILADALLKAGFDTERGDRRERGAYTVHLLVNKEYGFWTEDVQLVYVDGVFTSREAATQYAEDRARAHHEKHQVPVVGGWTWHSAIGHWAVFEDILAAFPRERTETLSDPEECHGECITRPHKWTLGGAGMCSRTGCRVLGTGDPCNDGNCEGTD
jgi:hypothetical protein